jgi:hypothetical protein
MGILVFRCPMTLQTFRSQFKATAEELRGIPPTATMELRCEICRQRHVFLVRQCTLDDQE